MKKTLEKIIFFGNEKLATGIPDVKPIIRSAVVAADFELEQVVTGKLSELRPHEAKLAVLAAYGRIIPQSVLDQFPLGIINAHPSLLPLRRGPTPIEQAMLDGASKTGVSIMRLTAGMDEGPIYKQKSVKLTLKESKAELTNRLQQLGSELLTEVLPAIAQGKLKPRGQPHSNRATYSHLLVKDDGIIDWKKPAEQIEREIRAYLDWPGSRTTIAGKEVIITKAHVEESKEQLVRQAQGKRAKSKVGEAFVTPTKQLAVLTGDGVLVIESLKPAGKNEMSGAEFIRGYFK